jgi:hypothetical protein
MAYQAMEDLAFNEMGATVNSLPNGRLGVLFHIKGRHDPPQKKQIRLSVMDLIRQRFMGKTAATSVGYGSQPHARHDAELGRSLGRLR